MTSLEPTLESLDALDADALCVVVTEDERPLQGAAGYLDWRLCGGLSRVLLRGFFKGEKGEQLLMPTVARMPVGRLFAVGAGPAKSLDGPQFSALMESAGTMLKKAGVAKVALCLPRCAVDESAKAEALKKKFVPAFGGSVCVLAEKGLRALL